jgi:YVTN family beta-propeller protein
MKQIKQQSLLCLFLALSIFASCKKDDRTPDEPEVPTAERKGLYVLCEGLFNANNTSLSYYNFDDKKLATDQFATVNGRGLGDTGNDIKVYGSKMYIVVNVSSTLEIVNAKSGLSVKKIDMKENGVGRQPRYVVFNKNKAYISSYDGTVAVLDTTSMAIEQYIKVGRNPEQMAVSNNKLYVANSGGLDYPNYDNTVSVIDLNTHKEIKKIAVVENARGVAADQYGDVYVLSTGNYGAVKPSMATIDSKTDVVKTQVNFSAGSMVINGDYAYIPASGGKVKVFNVKTETMEKENFITDDTKITTTYGVAVDEISGEVFVTDAKNYTTGGEVFCFDKDGKKKYSINVGINPNNVVFVNK